MQIGAGDSLNAADGWDPLFLPLRRWQRKSNWLPREEILRLKLPSCFTKGKRDDRKVYDRQGEK